MSASVLTRIFIESKQDAVVSSDSQYTYCHTNDDTKKPSAYLESNNIRSTVANEQDHYKSKTKKEPVPEWILQRREVSPDNSCLFTSISYLLTNGRASSRELRTLIAEAVLAEPELYSEVFLGKNPIEYSRWITKSTSWGGGIELAILSQHYGVEICVVDAKSVRIDRFGEDSDYLDRIFLIYNGVHFDPLELVDVTNSSMPSRRLFTTSEDEILSMALEVAEKAKKSQQRSSESNCRLQCSICGELFDSVQDVRKHAKDTIHTNFKEV